MKYFVEEDQIRRLSLLTSIVLGVLIGFQVVGVLGPGEVFASGEGDILVFLDGEEVSFSVPPSMEEGRTYVPMRRIFELFGAKVSWVDETKTVMASREDMIIELKIGEEKIKVNDLISPIDGSARIVDGSTMVPLRVISETLGANVDWDGKTRSIMISRSKPIKRRISNGSRSLDIGMSREELIGEMGEPARIDASPSLGNWYIYNNEAGKYQDYIQVKVEDNEVRGIRTNAKKWSIDGKIAPGAPYSESEYERDARKYGEENLRLNVLFRKDRGQIDHISLILKGDNEYILKGDIGSLEEEILEKQIFELTNVFRVGEGKQALKHEKCLADLAKEHSVNMARLDFFSHNDYQGRGFAHRIKPIMQKMKYRKAGENIAGSTRVHSGVFVNNWYNSIGHRENMLKDFNYLGVGVSGRKDSTYGIYATQNFACE